MSFRTLPLVVVMGLLLPGIALAEPSPMFRFVTDFEQSCHDSQDGPCDDQQLLQYSVDQAAAVGAVLYIDGQYTLRDTLILRKTTTIRGDGPNGGVTGTLLFDPPTGFRAMLAIEDEGKSDVVIADLYLEDVGTQGPTVAIDTSRHSVVHLERLQIAHFDVGVYGYESLSIWAEDCIVRNSPIAAFLLAQRSNSWRIRGGIASQSEVGIWVLDSRDVLVDAVRMESNQTAAILSNGEDGHLANNYFEGNGGESRTAVRLEEGASNTMLVGNYFARNGTVTQADDQLLRDRGRNTYRLDPRRDLQWADDLRVAGHLLLSRRTESSSTGIGFTSDQHGDWALRHLGSGDLALSRFLASGSLADIPLRVDHQDGGVQIGTDLQVGPQAPKICGGWGPPPNEASHSCDLLDGSMYLDSRAPGGVFFRLAGTWRQLALTEQGAQATAP